MLQGYVKNVEHVTLNPISVEAVAPQIGIVVDKMAE
jgi:hypothetical protein